MQQTNRRSSQASLPSYAKAVNTKTSNRYRRSFALATLLRAYGRHPPFEFEPYQPPFHLSLARMHRLSTSSLSRMTSLIFSTTANTLPSTFGLSLVRSLPVDLRSYKVQAAGEQGKIGLQKGISHSGYDDPMSDDDLYQEIRRYRLSRLS